MIWIIRDDPTQKIDEGTAFSLRSRDYKGAMIIVISEDNGAVDGELSSGELLRSGCILRYADNGDTK